MHGIAVSLNVDIHGLKSKFHDSSHAAAERHRPNASTGCSRVPVGCNDRLRGQIPALFQVVVDEVLQQQLIDVCTAAATGDRPDVVDEYAHDEIAWHRQYDDIGSQSKLPLSCVVAGRSRNLNDWTCSPNQLAWFARRQQEGGLHIAQAGNARRRRKRL